MSLAARLAITAIEMFAGCFVATIAAAQSPSAPPNAPAAPAAASQRKPDSTAPQRDKPAPPPAAVREYLGREVAQTMHYTGAPWLIRSEREQEERAAEMIEALHVQKGQTVCDLGAGNGFHSLKLARLVGDKGTVLAVDIQREMLLLLEARAKEAKLTNIKPVLGLPYDPKLEAGTVDLILLVDVYHEFSHPQQMLAAMRKSLKPRGRIALVEFRAEDDEVPIKPEHKMSKKQILKEFPANGFRLAEQYDKLPWQHLMFFERDDAPTDKAPTKKPAAEKPAAEKLDPPKK
jgi:ubiquinone/menaquinone biosynthesis C-methylase UbiE